MNVSFWLGVLRGILLGIIVGFPVSYPLTRILPNPFVGQLVFAALIAVLYVLWTFHNTPTKHKTAIRLFQTKRIRFGPQGKGYTEGVNCMLLSWPFFYPEDKPVAETTHRFDQMLAYSDDRVPVKVSGTFNSVIDDVYATYNISYTDATAATVSMVEKWIRAKVEDFSAEELVSQEAGTNSAKILLSTEAYEAAHAELTGPDAPWGRDITKALQINHIRLDETFESALRQREQEVIEGQSEKIQIERRLEQIDALKAKGVSADLAASFAQVEAGKPGAQLHTINIPGLSGIGDAASKAGNALGDWIKSGTKGATS